MATCAACGKDTSNPKFCSKSCAAKVNNVVVPKRRPESTCGTCGTPLPRGKKRCDECAAAEQAAAARRASNMRYWTTLAGAKAERQFERINTSSTLRFEHHTWRSDRLTPASSGNDLFDRLSAICFGTPEYITSSAAARHIVLMSELRDFRARVYRRNNEYQSVAVGDLSVSELASPMRDWVFSYFERGNHPLMPSFALDTACFVMAHIEGYYAYINNHAERWSLESIVEGGKERQREFINSQFKREFTMSLGRPLAVGAVPPNGELIADNDEVVAGAGTRFLFSVERCHLSSGVYDQSYFKARWQQKPKYDLCDDFAFYGAIWIFRDGDKFTIADIDRVVSMSNEYLNELNNRVLFGGLHMNLPAEWITDVIEIDHRQPAPTILPAPKWIAELD